MFDTSGITMQNIAIADFDGNVTIRLFRQHLTTNYKLSVALISTLVMNIFYNTYHLPDVLIAIFITNYGIISMMDWFVTNIMSYCYMDVTKGNIKLYNYVKSHTMNINTGHLILDRKTEVNNTVQVHIRENIKNMNSNITIIVYYDELKSKLLDKLEDSINSN